MLPVENIVVELAVIGFSTNRSTSFNLESFILNYYITLISSLLFPYSLQNFASYHNLPSGNNSSQGVQLLSELLYLYQQYNEARCQGRDSRDNQIPVLSLLPASGAPPDPQRPFHNPASVGGHQREDHRLLAN